MESPRKPRLEPRMVFALLLVAIPLLYVVAQLVLFRSGEECADSRRSEVGDFSQMFLPGDGCSETPAGR